MLWLPVSTLMMSRALKGLASESPCVESQRLNPPISRTHTTSSPLSNPASESPMSEYEGKYTPTQVAIIDKCNAVMRLLLAKNRSYGNSALEPLNVAANGGALELIAVRIDDKLSRIKNAHGLEMAMADTSTEDAVTDLIGYLILAQVAQEAL
jgi:hypothetical protein